MQENRISIELDLPGVRVVHQERGPGGEIRVVVVPTRAVAVCPRCGRPSAKVHDVRERVKADEPLGERRVSLVLRRRRFCCAGCERPFTEEEPICGVRRRLTRRLRARLGRESQERTVEQVAASYGVSPTTVRWAQGEYADEQQAAEPPAPVHRLGIDEFSVRRGRRYATGLHDLDRRALLEVVEGRDSATVQAALERLAAPEAVAVVSMDMSGPFRAAVEAVLPRAVIVADKFHVVARVNDALSDLWRRLARGRSREDPVRRHGRLVLRNRESLTPTQTACLRPLLAQSPSLRRAWLLKEDFRRWYATASPRTARLELRAWRRMMTEMPDLPEMGALTGMFDRWQEQILNYFTHRVTQGVVEGKNNRAKVIQRQAYGYRNFQNLRRRLLLAG